MHVYLKFCYVYIKVHKEKIESIHPPILNSFLKDKYCKLTICGIVTILSSASNIYRSQDNIVLLLALLFYNLALSLHINTYRWNYFILVTG